MVDDPEQPERPEQDPAVYDLLRRVADRMMGSERTGHTLQATALVHEAWLRMARHQPGDATSHRDRRHFMAIATKIMRRVLVDHARTRASERRGGERVRLAVDAVNEPSSAGPDLDLLALDECLNRLADIDSRQAKIVEYRFFGGLALDEIAAEMGLSARTVDREWARAKTWLYERMKGRAERDDKS